MLLAYHYLTIAIYGGFAIAMSTLTIPEVLPELGDFSSIVCFKAVVVGIEDALGEKVAAIALIAAGRIRSKLFCAAAPMMFCYLK
jgi:hypothetical protein